MSRNPHLPETRGEVDVYYACMEQMARQFAVKDGRVMMVKGQPLKEYIQTIKAAKKCALSQLRPQERAKEAAINQVDRRGVVIARVKSYTDPTQKPYIISYHPETGSVFCTCKSFEIRNPRYNGRPNYPHIDQDERLCKHCRDWKKELIEVAAETPFQEGQGA